MLYLLVCMFGRLVHAIPSGMHGSGRLVHAIPSGMHVSGRLVHAIPSNMPQL